MRLFLLLAFVALCQSIPVEDPSREVELVEAVNTNQRDPEGGNRFPIIVLTSRRRNPFFGGSFGGGFPFLNPATFFGSDAEDELFPVKDDDDELPEIPADELFPNGFGSIFGSGNDGDRRCGLLCNVLKSLDTHLKDLEEEVREIRDKQKNKENEVDEVTDEDDEEDNGPETSYEEKVLDDGRVLKINKTTYSDQSEDGSSFFSFSSTRVIHDGQQQDDDQVETNIEEEEEQVPEEEVPVISREVEEIENHDENVPDVVRIKRSGDQDNAFNQQQVDVSYLNDPFNQQQEDISYLFKAKNAINKKNKKKDKIPVYPPNAVNMASDTRVNEVLQENARRGGLVLLEPDAELLNDSN